MIWPLDDDANNLAESFAWALWSFPAWTHRRVESISFTDAETVRRHVSVDFTISTRLPGSTQAGVATWLIPLALLAKSPVTALDVRDEAGNSIPVLTTEQNGALSLAALKALALALTDSSDTGPIDDLLTEVVLGSPTEARIALAALKDRLGQFQVEGLELGELATISDFFDTVEPLCENFVLIAQISASAPARKVLKFSYEQRISDRPDEREPMERMTDALGWTPQTFDFAIPGAALAASFHFELRAPSGTAVTQADLLDDLQPRSVLSPPSRDGVPVIHLMTPRDPGAGWYARVSLRPKSGGWLRTAMLVSWVIAMLMIMNAVRLPALDQQGGAGTGVPTDVAALLMALVAVLAAILLRPDEHALTARLLTWARGVAMIGVALPFIAAWTLVFGPSGAALRSTWWVLAAVAIGAAEILTRSYRGPRTLPHS